MTISCAHTLSAVHRFFKLCGRVTRRYGCTPTVWVKRRFQSCEVHALQRLADRTLSAYDFDKGFPAENVCGRA